MRKILFYIKNSHLLIDLDKVSYAICSHFEGARIYTVVLILAILMEVLDLIEYCLQIIYFLVLLQEFVVEITNSD